MLYNYNEMARMIQNCMDIDQLLEVEDRVCFLIRNKYIPFSEASIFYEYIKTRADELEPQQ